MAGETKDVYDDAVEWLTAHPDRISPAWQRPYSSRFGFLFGFTGADTADRDCEVATGCLTQVKAGFANAGTPALTEAIRADPRIPDSMRGINPTNLHVFAEWRRRLDKEFGRVPPSSK
jgi:hypothetical protein